MFYLWEIDNYLGNEISGLYTNHYFDLCLVKGVIGDLFDF